MSRKLSLRLRRTRRANSNASTNFLVYLTCNSIVKFHNQSLRFLLLPPACEASSLFPILDGCAAADFVMVAASSEEEVDSQGETCLRCLTGTGVGASGGVIGVVKVGSLPRMDFRDFQAHVIRI